MRKNVNKILMIVLSLSLMLIVKTYALNSNSENNFEILDNTEYIYLNPCYPDITEEDLVDCEDKNEECVVSNEIIDKGNISKKEIQDLYSESEITTPLLYVDANLYNDTLQEAADVLKTSLKNRENNITIYYKTNEYKDKIWSDIFSLAIEHTGVPTEGDYIKWQYGGYRINQSGNFDSGTYYLMFTYTMTYYTTAEQESEMDTEVNELLETDAIKNAKNDYEKITAIYNYMCDNITYDYTNLNDTTYMLKYTAYAALANKTAVCQGYAVLFYRLVLSEGIDTRLIPGCGSNNSTINHAWNIVKINDLYYDLDSTWDAGKEKYNYYLLCEDSFRYGDYIHKRSDEYNTENFNETYPMSSKDFNLEEYLLTLKSGVYEDEGVYKLYENGEVNTTYTGLYKQNDETWCIINGVSITNTESIWDSVTNCRYKLTENGKVDTTYTGLVNVRNLKVYLENGKTNNLYTGLYTQDDETWCIINGTSISNTESIWDSVTNCRYKLTENGKVDTTYIGLVNVRNLKVYMENGKTNNLYTGLYTQDDETWCIINGVSITNTESIWDSATNCRYKLTENGKVDITYTGLVNVRNLKVYMENGKTNNLYTGLYTQNNETLYIINGICDYSYNGTYFDGTNNWNIINSKATKVETNVSAFVTPTNNDDSNLTNLVLFVKFKDDTRDIFNAEYDYGSYKNNNWQDIKNMFNKNIEYTGIDDSFKEYINEISEGNVKVNNIMLQESADESKVYTYTLSKNKDGYVSGDGIVSEIIDAINSGKINNNFGNIKYDYKNAGILDNLMIVIQGTTTGNYVSEDVMINHKADYGGQEKINGLSVGTYVILNSSSLVYDNAYIDLTQDMPSEAGVISHEFLHTLGFPDLYRTTESGKPVGVWDIMASVSYMKQYPLSYLRAKQGWIESKDITKAGTYTLDAVSEEGDNKVFIIKTPLSENEYIAVEYRKKQDKSGETDYGLTSSGLIVYRINDGVENLTNVEGNNYIYVYRPNVTTSEGATDQTYILRYDSNGNPIYVNNVYDATINPDDNETEYGSLDLSATYSDNTIYYSNGKNSGIKLSNIKYSEDKNQITFDIDFADYSLVDVWDDNGIVKNNGYNDVELYYDEENNILYSSFQDESNNAIVKKYENGVWSKVGDSVNNASYKVKVISNDNKLYMATIDYNTSNIKLYKLDSNNNTWSIEKTYEYSSGASGVQFVKDGNTLYICCYSDTQLDVFDVETEKKYASKTANYFSNPILEFFNNELYIEYSDFFGEDKTGKLEKYTQGSWQNVISYSGNSNMHTLVSDSNYLYGVFGESGKVPLVFKIKRVKEEGKDNYAVEEPEKIELSEVNGNYMDITLSVINGNVYVIYVDQNDSNTTKVIKIDFENSVSLFNDSLGSNLNNVKMVSDNNKTLYAVYTPEGSCTYYVKRKTIF